jgi:hypothetical protein
MRWIYGRPAGNLDGLIAGSAATGPAARRVDERHCCGQKYSNSIDMADS